MIDSTNANVPENKPTGKKKDQYPFARIETELSRFIDGIWQEKIDSEYGRFPYKFRTVRLEEDDSPIVIEVVDNTAVLRKVEYVGKKLKEYCQNLYGKAVVYNIARKRLIEVAHTWADMHEHLREMPVPVVFKGDKRLAWKRLPFNPEAISYSELAKRCPVFHDYLERMDEGVRNAVCARIGSIADPDANLKQLLWFYGDTNGGKSQLAYLLKELVGKQNYDILNLSVKEEYWQAKLLGKRIIVVNEAPVKFINSNVFKIMTGEAEQSGRSPYGQIVNFVSNAIFVSYSNEEPVVPDDDSLKSRLIICKLDAIPKEKKKSVKKVKEALIAESSDIMKYCWHVYETTCESGMPIPTDEKVLQSIIDRADQSFGDFAEWYIEPAEGDPRAYVLINDLKDKAAAWGLAKNNTEKELVIEKVLKTFPHARRERPRIDGRRLWAIKGLWLKHTSAPSYAFKPAEPVQAQISPVTWGIVHA